MVVGYFVSSSLLSFAESSYDAPMQSAVRVDLRSLSMACISLLTCSG